MCWRGAISRYSRLEIFYKKEVLKNFAQFTGKHLGRNFKNETPAKMLSWEICEIFYEYLFYKTPTNNSFCITSKKSNGYFLDLCLGYSCEETRLGDVSPKKTDNVNSQVNSQIEYLNIRIKTEDILKQIQLCMSTWPWKT